MMMTEIHCENATYATPDWLHLYVETSKSGQNVSVASTMDGLSSRLAIFISLADSWNSYTI
jgi:hypothetical protein